MKESPIAKNSTNGDTDKDSKWKNGNSIPKKQLVSNLGSKSLGSIPFIKTPLQLLYNKTVTVALMCCNSSYQVKKGQTTKGFQKTFG